MTKVNLKNTLNKKNAGELVLELIASLKIIAWIEDTDGIVLAGQAHEKEIASFPISADGITIGWVKGDEQSAVVARLLNQLMQKEAEKKKLITEVLHLYQEVNLMFDFSDKLAKKIGAAAIAHATLEEASRVIHSDNGLIVLLEDSSKELIIVASLGESIFNQPALFTQLIHQGQSGIINDHEGLINSGIIPSPTHSVIYAPLKVNDRILGAIMLSCNDETLYTAEELKLLTALAFQSSAAIESALLYEKNLKEAREREEAMRKIYEATAKFVPYEYVRFLGHKVITDVKLGDHVEKIVTVLFSDIREYTSIAERMTPAENFRFICSINELMGPFIRKHGGFVNQYLGDSIMAIFPGNASDALAAAVDMQKEVEKFNFIRQQNNLHPIEIGIGMHTGPLIMGITGDSNRMDACTISDTVNTASRIEGLTKFYHAGIILSEASLEHLANKENFHLRGLGWVQLKGKQESIMIYECFSGNKTSNIQQKLVTLPFFIEAITLYSEKSFTRANELFGNIVTTDPDDYTARFFFQHTREISSEEIGMIKMNEK